MSLEDDLNAIQESRRAAQARLESGWVPPPHEPSTEEAFAEEFIAAATKREIAPEVFLVVGKYDNRLVGAIKGWGPLLAVSHDGDSRSPDPDGVITVDRQIYEVGPPYGRVRGIRRAKWPYSNVVIHAHEGRPVDRVFMSTHLREAALKYLDENST
jgi:hypothetical protein